MNESRDAPIVNYQHTNPAALLELANRLFINDSLRLYLTPHQLLILQNILAIGDSELKLKVWNEFISGNAALDVETIDNDASSRQSTDETSSAEEEQEDELTQLDFEDFKQQVNGFKFIGNMSLKLRYVLWQYGIDPLLVGDDEHDFLLLETLEETPQAPADSDDKSEDDDYDEDSKDTAEKVERAQPTKDIGTSYDEENRLVLHLRISKDDLSNLKSYDIEKLITNWNKIYHTFENDKETMLKRLKLEANDKLLENGKGKRRHSETDFTIPDTQHNSDVNGNKTLDATANTNNEEEHQDGKRPRHENTPKTLQVNLGTANLSLKYLLATVQENKSKLKMSDYELKRLINDVRKNRSKWASDERIGQEELYEACEKVVMELRNFTEHSTPFLNKVSKREAPNYHLIIKKSMDLNTVLKKLKTFQYNSKQEFVEDIMLIWKNCLTYNSDPAHFLRGHAIAMQKKSLQLIPLIPDIVVRKREDVENEIENMGKDKGEEGAGYDDDDDDDEEAAGSGRKGLTMGAHKPATKSTNRENSLAIAGNNNEQNKQDTPPDNSVILDDAETKENSSTEEQEKTQSSTLKSNETEKTNSNQAKHIAKSEHDEDAGGNEEEDEEEDEEEEDENGSHGYILERDDDKDDLELSVWKNATAKIRAEICVKRFKYFKSDHLDRESEAFLKNPNRMKPYATLLSEYQQQKTIEGDGKHFEQESVMKNGFGAGLGSEDLTQEEDGREETLENHDETLEKNHNDLELDNTMFLEEYDVTDSLPYVDFVGTSSEEIQKEEDAAIKYILSSGSRKKDIFKATADQGLTPKINKNIALIQQIRHICHKISLIRMLQNPHYSSKNSADSARFINSKQLKQNFLDTVELDPVSQLPSRNLRKDRYLMEKIMRKNISKVAMTNGFESAQPSALNILTDIASEYLSNLIASIKLHYESNSLNEKKTKDILQMSLLENGINKPDDLYTYIETEFGKKTKKLQDIRTKLENFLKDLLRPTLQELSERNFEDQSQSFLTGDFATELTGEDFFGFKELGLEKEFGVLSSSVPFQLLTMKMQGSDLDTKEGKTKKIQPEEHEHIVYAKVTKDAVEKGQYWSTLSRLLKKAVDATESYNNKLTKKVPELPDDANMENSVQQTTILEDDEIPVKGKPRPRVPPTGKISTAYRRRLVADAFFLPEEDTKLETLPNNQTPAPAEEANGLLLGTGADSSALSLDSLFDQESTPMPSSLNLSMSRLD